MNHLIKHLEDKAFWYKKYLHANEAFLSALKHAPDIALDELDLFYGNRESLLKILEDLDQKIQICLNNLERTDQDANSDQKTKIHYYIREKDTVIQRIVELDKEIIDTLEEVRTRGIAKARALTEGKKALSGYKSGQFKNERLDKRV